MWFDSPESMIQALGEELMAIKAWIELSFLGLWSYGFFFLAPSGMRYPRLFLWSIWVIISIFFRMHADSGWNPLWQYVHFSPFLPFSIWIRRNRWRVLSTLPSSDLHELSFFPLSLYFLYWWLPSCTVSACAFGPLIFPMLISLFCSCVRDSIRTSREGIFQVAPEGSLTEWNVDKKLSILDQVWREWWETFVSPPYIYQPRKPWVATTNPNIW